MHRGYVKLWRKIEDWSWYKDSNTFALFMHLLISANYKESNYRGVHIPKGSLVSGLYALSEQTGLSVQSVRTALEHLKSTNDITIKSTNRFSVISIQNYKQYQENSTSPITNKPTNDQQTTNKQLTTSKECKEYKNEKKWYGEHKLVSLTDEEYQKLGGKLGDQLQTYVSRLEKYIGSKGDKYKSHYFTILNWYGKDNEPTNTTTARPARFVV